MSTWKIQDSIELYNVQNWGHDFFNISEEGNVVVQPTGDKNKIIDLKKLIDELQSRGIQLPILLRFSDILRQRIKEICGAFENARKEFKYTGEYRGVYPVKVNQVRQVVESIVDAGRPYNYGLEAGSKPELLMVLSMIDNTEALVICNGYKDEEFIELALLGSKLGIRIVLVIEKYSELMDILKISKKLDVKPRIGLRARLSAKGAGKWRESGGDRSKFGLGSIEIMRAIDHLRAEGYLDCLQLLHYHLGSQVSSIRALRYSLREAARYYVELKKMGAALNYIDIGGGLAVDYDGSRTNFASSANYSVQEYANTVIYEIQTICDEAEVVHPTLVTEAGRALTAYHSVLVCDVLGVTEVPNIQLPEQDLTDAPLQVGEIVYTYKNITRKNFQEAFHDVVDLREQVLDLFKLGYVSLEWRAYAEAFYWAALHKIWDMANQGDYIPEELIRLEKELSDIYFCNISVFQSLPDVWAINQIFPVMPIQRLKEEPTRRAVLADVSCDSDGKVDKFIDMRDVKNTLPLHALKDEEQYIIGFFMVGAYQEILGDLHNLFGDNNAVHISWDEDLSNYTIEHVEDGDTVTEVLNYVQQSRDHLIANYRAKTETALRQKQITIQEARHILDYYRQGFDGYTYLEN